MPNDVFIDVWDDKSVTAVSGRTISTGSGNDLVDITATSARGDATAVQNSTVYTGTGHDTITLSASSWASGMVYAMDNSALHTGTGNNFIGLQAGSANWAAFGTRFGSIWGGAGNDTLSIEATGGVRAQGICGTIVDLGDGSNRFDVIATATSVKDAGLAAGVEGGRLTGGNGDDRFTILSSSFSPSSSSIGVIGSTIDMGEGNNTLHVEAQTRGSEAIGLSGTTISGGNEAFEYSPEFGTVTPGPGSDSFMIIADSVGRGSAVGARNVTIDMKNGTNFLDISALAASGSAQALHATRISGGKDADEVNITAKSSGAGVAQAMSFTSINVGDGENKVTVIAESAGGQASGMDCEIVGGKDRDIVSVLVKSGGTGFARAISCSSIDVKDGENTVTVRAEAAAGEAYAMTGNGVVRGGNGDDDFSVSAKSGGTGVAYALDHFSTVDAGNGNNAITVQAESQGGRAAVLYTQSQIITGSGDDSVTLTAVSGSGEAVGIDSSKMFLGNGNNTAFISAHSGKGNAWGTYLGILTGGSGRDDITIEAQSDGRGEVYAVRAGAVNVGDGDNTVHLSAASAAGNAYGFASVLTGGENADSVFISARAGGSGTAAAVQSGLLDLKGGHNEVSVSASAVDGTAYGLYDGQIRSGAYTAEQDVVSIKASADGNGSAVGLNNFAQVNLYGGDDVITVHAHSDLNGNAQALRGGSIYAGDGNDTITAMATSNAFGARPSIFQGGLIDAGNGDDEIFLITTGLLASSLNSRVEAGAGNDIVHLVYDGTGTAVDFTTSKQSLTTLDGGSNAAVSHAKADGGTAQLGDILSLEHGYADTSLLPKLASQVTVKNFEALMLDFNNGAAENIALDSMLDAVKNLFGKANSMSSLVVKGDAADILQAAGLHAVEQHTGVEVQGVSTDAFGNDITFTHYTINYQNEEFNLYLQTNVSIA